MVSVKKTNCSVYKIKEKRKKKKKNVSWRPRDYRLQNSRWVKAHDGINTAGNRKSITGQTEEIKMRQETDWCGKEVNNKQTISPSQNTSLLINPLNASSWTVTLYFSRSRYSPPPPHTFICFDSLPAFPDTPSVTVNEAAAAPWRPPLRGLSGPPSISCHTTWPHIGDEASRRGKAH